MTGGEKTSKRPVLSDLHALLLAQWQKQQAQQRAQLYLIVHQFVSVCSTLNKHHHLITSYS